jgi:HlyD family secretion protein
VSPANGRILEITAQKGKLIDKGAPILTLEHIDDAAKGLEAIVYVPPTQGKKLSIGMKIFISPFSVKREESGSILGKVVSLSEFPATPQGMMRSLQNERLVQSLSSGGAPIEIHADLIADPATTSGYKWSSGKGPQMKLQSGTLCTGSIVVEEQPPVNLVIPWLKKSLFGEQAGGN